jgi:hypothetical protein
MRGSARFRQVREEGYGHERQNQDCFAADAVAVIAKNQPAERAEDEADHESRIGQHGETITY